MENLNLQRTVGFGEAIKRAFSNYCVFTGRASRSEYWRFALFTSIVGVLIGGPNLVSAITDPGNYNSENSIGIFGWIWSLAIFLPCLGLSFRRLHDTGKTGWWILINFIPFIGNIVFIVFMALPSQPVPNKYGPVPNM